MGDRNRSLRTCVLASIVAILATGTDLRAQGDGLSEKDQSELRGVVLTLESLTKLVKTQEAYVKLLRTDAQFRARMKEPGDDGDSKYSIDGVAALFEKLPPKAKAAITSQGLTPRQYAVLTMAALVNGIAYAGSGTSRKDGPLPPGATMANIEFVRKHANHPVVGQWRQLVGEMEELEGGDEDEDEK